MYLPALPRHSAALGPLQHRRRSLDLYGDVLARRYRREPYDLDQRLARRHYSEPPLTSSTLDKRKTIDEATVAIVEHIEKSKDKIWRGIRADRRALSETIDVDLAAFLRDSARLFDRAFFNNTLHKHVKLVLDDPKEEILPGHGGKTKMTPDGSSVIVMLPMVSIKRALLTRRAAFLNIAWATILHQLIHAYFMVACGIQNDGKDPDGRLKHGEHFGCLMYKISDVFAKNDHPISLGFGHPSLPRQNRRLAIELTRDRILRAHKKHSTECPWEVEVIKKEKIGEWYKKKCVKAVDPDIFIFNFEQDIVEDKPFSKCGDKEDWVELVLGKKAYKLDRKAPYFSCLKKKFEDDNRKFDMPSWVELEVLKSFMSFLTRGRWDPDIRETQNGTEGPALLLKYSHNAETPVQHDIAMYQLGLCLDIEHVRRIAHSRLVSHQFTHESGHDIVRAIYCDPPHPLDEGLRAWARKFFERHSTPKSGQKPIDCSNWKILQDDIVFQTGYFGSKKTILSTDMRKAEEALDKAGEEMNKEKKEDEKGHSCSAFCSFTTCPVFYHRTYGGFPPPLTHQSQALVPYASYPPPPPPIPAPYLSPPAYIPQIMAPPPPPPAIVYPPPPPAITYPSDLYAPRPHIQCPEYLTLLRQRSDHSWLARDSRGEEWILRREWSHWMRERDYQREIERVREWKGESLRERILRPNDAWLSDDGYDDVWEMRL